MPRPNSFRWVEFLRDHEVVEMHFAGQKVRMRDWLAASLVRDGIARYCVCGCGLYQGCDLCGKYQTVEVERKIQTRPVGI